MCHSRPQKKIIQEVRTLSTTCVRKQHKTKAATVLRYLQYSIRETVCQMMS